MICVEEREEREVEEYKMVEMKSSGDEFVFTFKDTHNSVVNSIRRIIIDEVPTMAIEDVEIVENGSPLYDETIAHRLGLVPLTTDLSSYNFKESCKCGGVGCALCEVKLYLKADEDGYVKSSSITSDDPKVAPASKEIPITKLMNGKRVEINSKAILGRGIDHAKWAPAHSYLRESGKSVELIVEPFGQLGAKEIYNKSIDILVDKVDELVGELK